jgi:cytochrome c oxidase subunit 2
MLIAILAQATQAAARATTGPTRDGGYWMPRQSSTVAGDVDNVFDFIYWLSLFFFVLITVMLIAFIWKYRHREGVRHEPAAGHSTALELTWTLIPTVLVLVIFYFGFRGFMNMTIDPPNSYEVGVTGRMWSWGFAYEGRYFSNDGKLHVPVNTPIRLVTSSDDVIHSFFIPAFRVKKDVVPGRYNRMWFEATELGEFDVYCTEYCGTNHSTMLTSVVVHTMPEFQEKLAEFKDWTRTMTPVEAGRMLVESRGCKQCHSTDGSVVIGPTLKDLYGSQVPVVGQGNVLADEAYIRESILYPQTKVHQGFGPPSPMPSFLGQLNDNDLMAINWYLKSISANYKGDLIEGKKLLAKPGGGTTQPSATQPAETVPRQNVNTNTQGGLPSDPNKANDNQSQKKEPGPAAPPK